jgi:hypothetical protein
LIFGKIKRLAAGTASLMIIRIPDISEGTLGEEITLAQGFCQSKLLVDYCSWGLWFPFNIV